MEPAKLDALINRFHGVIYLCCASQIYNACDYPTQLKLDDFKFLRDVRVLIPESIRDLIWNLGSMKMNFGKVQIQNEIQTIVDFVAHACFFFENDVKNTGKHVFIKFTPCLESFEEILAVKFNEQFS